MKKIITLTFGLMFLITLSYAEKNDNELNLMLGFGGSLTKTQLVTTPQDNTEWEAGGTGVVIASNFLHSVSDEFFIGPEIFYSNLGSGSSSQGIDISSRHTNFYASAKYLIKSTDEKNKFYIPFGIGFGKTKVEANSIISGKISRKCNDFAWYLGFGWQQILDPKHSIGLEFRYTTNYVDGDVSTGLRGTDILNHYSFMFKVGFDI